jgi:hypothetical protein
MTETLSLDHTFGSIKRTGEWEVPARVVLRQRMGSASLDLTDATFEGTHTELVLDMIGGSIELRLPDDMQVVTGLSTTFASYEDHRKDSARGERTLTISGRAVWGSVEVRGRRTGLLKRG